MTKPKPIRSKQFNGLCPECGQAYINIFNSLYASCPNAHGKLIERLTVVERNHAKKILRERELEAKYPMATLVEGTKRYEIGEGQYRLATTDGEGYVQAIRRNKRGNLVLCFFRPVGRKARRKPKKDVQPV